MLDGLYVFSEDTKRRFRPLLTFVAILWIVEIVDRLIFGGALDNLGITPRSMSGLRGILLAPLLHGSFSHLLANTVPFIILSLLVLARHETHFAAITFVIVLVSGLGIWLIAPPHTVHIGLSGVIFGYFAYQVVNAWYERSFPAIGLAVLVIVLYGSLIMGAFPTGGSISWQGHLFGIIGGAAAAYLYSPRRI